jgi:SAM-dependent methyltransferase
MSNNQINLDRYFDAVFDEELVSTRSDSARRKLRFFLDSLFKKTEFQNKSMVDVGGGNGIFTFYAACSGASEVTCLEPEAAGCRSGMISRFKKVQNRLQLANVRLVTETLQSFECDRPGFDIILLHNSVNHLDEPACIKLKNHSGSRDRYNSLFSKIFSIANDGAKLIVSDCSRDNVFAHVGMKNPFAPSIEWHKHQSPDLWVELLGGAGFCNPEVKWKAPSATRDWGEKLLGNRVASYFLTSHFTIEMQKPGDTKKPRES